MASADPTQKARTDTILAIESSCEYLQLALQGKFGTRSIVLDEGLKHAERLVPEMQRLTQGAGIQLSQLQGIVCSQGPGSFTGLRIGIAAAKGIGEACAAPVLSIGTLSAIDYAHRDMPGLVISAIDGKKGRYYCRIGFNSLQPTTALLPSAAYFSQDMDISAGDLSDIIHSQAFRDELKRIAPVDHTAIWIGGPHSNKLAHELREIDHSMRQEQWKFHALGFRPWATALLEMGRVGLSQGKRDEPQQGPRYLRVSEAELGITRKETSQ